MFVRQQTTFDAESPFQGCLRAASLYLTFASHVATEMFFLTDHLRGLQPRDVTVAAH